MDVLLIDPPFYSLKGTPNDVGYNLGLTSLAAYLNQRDFDCAVVMGDLLTDIRSVTGWGWFHVNLRKYEQAQLKYCAIVDDRNHPIWQKIFSIVKDNRPKAVGIAYLTPFRNAVERIAGIVKEVDPDIKVIVGAAHPTICPEEVVQNPNVDFVVCGEGEIPLAGLAEQLRNRNPDWRSVPGIFYKDEFGQVVSTPRPAPIKDLDELPFVARELVLGCDYNRYRVHCLTTARGCPYSCSFCSDRCLWEGRVRRRTVDNVISELKYLENKYKVDMVIFSDGTFTFDRKYVEAFCRALIDNEIKIKWQCTARYDNLDEELIQLMKSSNCSGLYLGAESGSDRILGSIDKKITAAQILRVSEMVTNAGLHSVTGILIGLPDETREDIEATLDLMRNMKTGAFDVNNFTPLPGTPAWDMIDPNHKKDLDWRKIGYKFFDNYFVKDVSYEEFRGYMEEAYKIAASRQRKTVTRFGLRLMIDSMKGLLSK